MARNFDQKIFWFPDSYIELRKELTIHWPTQFKNWRCGWAMAFDAEEFVSYMNEWLGEPLKITPATRDDELRIDHICGVFLKELRKKRGEANP